MAVKICALHLPARAATALDLNLVLGLLRAGFKQQTLRSKGRQYRIHAADLMQQGAAVIAPGYSPSRQQRQSHLQASRAMRSVAGGHDPARRV